MFDMGFSLAPILAEVMQRDRERRIHNTRWVRQLRQSERRAQAGTAPAKKVIVGKPSHLAGVHRL